MTRLTGTIIFSLALCAVATVAVAGNPGSYTLTPSQAASQLTVRPVTPITRAQTSKPQPGEAVYITEPALSPALVDSVNKFSNSVEPINGSASYVITSPPEVTR